MEWGKERFHGLTLGYIRKGWTKRVGVGRVPETRKRVQESEEKCESGEFDGLRGGEVKVVTCSTVGRGNVRWGRWVVEKESTGLRSAV